MATEMSQKNIGMIPHSCIVKLQAVYGTLKSAEKKAADLLLEKPGFFSEASIVEAADAAGCSEATLVRLARKLGYAGYPELRSHLGSGERDKSIALYAGITQDDEYDSVIYKVFQASIQALKDTLDVIDKDEYKKAIEALASAGTIVLCGAGDAANVALSGFQKFIRVGANVQASADPDVQMISISHLVKGDVIIAISHSGRTKSVIDAIKYSRITGATTICITNYPLSPLAKSSDIVLLTAAFSEHVNGEVMSKRVAELCLVESLFVNVLLLKKDQYINGLIRSNNALKLNKI